MDSLFDPLLLQLNQKYRALLRRGLSAELAQHICALFLTGDAALTDFDDQFVDVLSQYDPDDILFLLGYFQRSRLENTMRTLARRMQMLEWMERAVRSVVQGCALPDVTPPLQTRT